MCSSDLSGGLTGGLPSLAGYGKVSKGVHRQDKRNVAQKGLDAVSGFLTFTSRSNDVPISSVVFFWRPFHQTCQC